MVAQRDHGIGRAKSRKKKRLRIFALALSSTASPRITMKLWKRYKNAKKDVKLINMRQKTIKSSSFNVNTYCDKMALHDFRFKVSDLKKIMELLHLPTARTRRRRYYCDKITSCCIVLKRLSSPCTWMDMEETFGMRSCALSEVFWECTENFTNNHGHLVTNLKTEFLRQRAALYAECVKDKGAPLDKCVAFIDCTKIRMQRPGGQNSNQISCYSGHKRMPCLSYQTLTTPDGLIFSLYGPEVGRRHDMTLLRGSGLNDILQTCLNIDGVQ